MTDQTQLIAKTVLDTLYTLGPAILASGLTKSPRVVAISELMPVILEIFSTAKNAVAAGEMTEAELAKLFAEIGGSIQISHDKWAAMNQAQS